MSIYDDPDLRTGDFQTWDDIGDTLAGDIIDVRKGEDFNGRPCPELVIRNDDGRDIVMTCGQANLRAQIMDLKPETGDRIKVAFVRTEKADKGQKKIFEIKVVQGGAKGTAHVERAGEEPF